MSAIFGADKKAITAITANDGIATRKISAVWGNVGGQKTKLWELHKELTIGSLPVGSLLKIAENGITQQYIIVNQGNPNTALYDISCNGTWVMRKNVAGYETWNSESNNYYVNSTVHKYLNDTIFKEFSGTVQATIKSIKLPYSEGYGSQVIDSGSNGLSTKVFLLSGYEIGFTTSDGSGFPLDGEKLSYFESGKSASANKKRIAMTADGSRPYYWWTRSPYLTSGYYYIWNLTTEGNVDYNSCTQKYGVRPAMILNSAAIVSQQPDSDGCYTLI